LRNRQKVLNVGFFNKTVSKNGNEHVGAERDSKPLPRRGETRKIISFLAPTPSLHTARYTTSFHLFSSENIRKMLFFLCSTPLVCLGLLLVEVARSLSDPPHLVGLLLTNEQPVAKNSTWQHTTLTRQIFAPGEIWTLYPSKRTAADPRLSRRGHWDPGNM